MNYKYIYLPIVILIVLVSLRVISYHDTIQVEYCDECEVVDGKVFWVPPKLGERNTYWRSGKVLYLCSRKLCKEEPLDMLGDKYHFTGWVSKDSQGSQVSSQLIVEIRKISIDKEFADSWGRILSSFLINISEIREYVEYIYQLYFSDPYLSLLSGIVLGVSRKFDKDLYQALIETGTVHVVAASGFNITIIAKLAFTISLIIFTRKKAIVLAIGAIVFYTLIAGSSPAIIRAALMGILAFGAQAVGREYLARWGLIISAMIMLIISPELLWDVSFQLSMAATAGILWGVGPINKFIKRSGGLLIRKVDGTEEISQGSSGWQQAISNDLATTIAATLATLPIIMIVFGRISLVSPVVNMIVLWMVPPIMILGGVVLVLSLIWGGLGLLASWLLWPLLYVFVWVVESFSAIPFASVEVENIPWVFGIGWWLLLMAWWVRKGRELS